MSLFAKVRLGTIFLLWAPFAAAQSNLGELLDAGAKKLSAEQFREEVVQRVIVGPSTSGLTMEVMYASNGVIQGRGGNPQYTSAAFNLAPVNGEWTTDDNGRVCTTMRIGSGPQGVILPPRCQFWFKYADQYFFSDSDSDRRARVLSRTVKQ